METFADLVAALDTEGAPTYEEEAELASHIAEQGLEAGFSPAVVFQANERLHWLNRKLTAQKEEVKADSLPVGHEIEISGYRAYNGIWRKNWEGLWDQKTGEKPLVHNADAHFLGFSCGEVF